MANRLMAAAVVGAAFAAAGAQTAASASGQAQGNAAVSAQEKAKQDAERSKERKSQIGTGDRSERIRTYNFPQGRLTDHRINLTIYQLDRVMEGGIEEILDALSFADQESKLADV